MKAREEILARINAANVTAPTQAVRRGYVHDRQLPDRLGHFVERVEDYKATVIRTGHDGVAQAVTTCLAGAATVVVPDGFTKDWLPTGIDIIRDNPPLANAELDKIDAVITTAVVGIAVTGTIVLDHTQGQGRRALTLVPDLHVCVITADQIVGDVPESVARLANSVNNGRPLTWISGGSATSDIELQRVEGVHGPRTLCVVLVE